MQSLNNIFGPNNDIEIQKAKKKFSSMTTKNLHGHLKRGNYLAWNITGDKLASGSMDDSVRVWSSIERKSHNQNDSLHLKGHTGSINQVAWNPMNAETLASTSDDKTIKLWDARNGTCTSNLETKTESTSLVWSPDGNTIIIAAKAYMGGQVDALLLLDVRMSAKLKKVIKFHYSVNHMAWHKDSANHIYLATGKGDVEIFNYLPEFKALKLIDAHTSPAFCVEFSPNGNYFAVGSADTLVSLWDKKDHVCLRTFGNLTAAVKSISFSHDNQYIAIGGSEDNFIDISHLESGENIHTVQNGSPINCVSWHPKKHLLAYAGKEKDKHDRDAGCIKVFGFH